MDGRDGWLSTIAFHAVWDRVDRGDMPDAAALGQLVWDRFAATADISRPRGDGPHSYTFDDARRKVRDKLRLHGEGTLPPRRDRGGGAVTPD
jgi:hypothetical protein